MTDWLGRPTTTAQTSQPCSLRSKELVAGPGDARAVRIDTDLAACKRPESEVCGEVVSTSHVSSHIPI